MNLIVCKDYNEMSEKAARIVAACVTLKPDCVIGLATGSTPVGMYKCLIEKNKAGKLDFSRVRTYNLDEYYPIDPTNEQSYRYFMDKNLFDSINIDKANTHVMNGKCEDPEKETADYDKAIEAAGGIDIQVLGIGRNGHIGFNEPNDSLDTKTHVTYLTESTLSANSRFFSSIDEVPKKAITMGVSTILKSKKIVMLASGSSKHHVIKELLSEKVNTAVPATLLNIHRDVVVICDEEAYYGNDTEKC